MLSPLEVMSVAFVSVSDFIFHIVYVIDECKLASTLPPLSFIDMIYCSPETKVTPASASIFRLIWISLLHNVVKRFRNRTARFRCVFGSTGGYGA
jgi:hypothetical protein